MQTDVYQKLANVLDTLPNGFPASETGVELKLLKMIFSPEDAELFCDLRLSYETAEQISQRTGRSLEGLEDHLREMWKKGQITGVDFGAVCVYRMMPWVFGVFEFQLNHLTPEMAALCREYEEVCSKEFFTNDVPLMNVVPVEEEISSNEMSMPFEQVSAIIEKGKSFAVNECICKKEHALTGEPCDRPTEVCMAIAPIPDFFKPDDPMKARPITKEEAYDILKMSEENALVHMTSNIEKGHYFICNCCGCCCGVLRGAKKYGGARAVNSNYFALIDAEACVSCGVCADERCQVDAIEETDEGYRVLPEQCIGCGLCISTCPSGAISLERKNQEEIILPPVDEKEWFKRRAATRGVDYSRWA